MLELINKTGSNSKIGFAVVLDPTDNQSFIYARHGSSRVLGIVTQSVPYRAKCKIATQGDKANVYVSANAVKDNVIRLSKSTDRASLGVSVVAKTGDAPYLRIGTALSNGRGLIPMILELTYEQSLTSTSGIVTPTTFPYTVGISDTLVVIDSAIAVVVNLPASTGLGREIKVASIGVGEVTVTSNGTDEIDGEATQPINQWDTIVMIDYETANWKII